MKQFQYAPMRRIILASMILVPLITFVLILGIGYYYWASIMARKNGSRKLLRKGVISATFF